MERDFWDKLRLLVTNNCNYRCPFCHNEGQSKSVHFDKMSYSHLVSIIDIVKDQKLSEICFSGGEPFLNKEIVDMIIYANKETDVDISCATNLSLINREDIKRLSKTRVKFNIQFPYADETKFCQSTGHKNWDIVLKNIDAVRKEGIYIGLNSVIQNGCKQNVREMIEFAIAQELPLKLLPQIGLDGSERFKNFVYPILKEYATNFTDKHTGATRWVVESGKHKSVVLYIDSPCFSHNIEECRNYGELRIQPNLQMQTCILTDETEILRLDKGKDFALQQMKQLWKDFKHC